ncbi:uncharacterized protein LOC135817877 [Sycon ciliatum]|uniref:uncharacterized protein LOC135817877 n=1 Tax=Sycon ciliatum TaxID=27933 RepID=UPI0031F60DA6
MSYSDIRGRCGCVSEFIRFRQTHRLQAGNRELSRRHLSLWIHPNTSLSAQGVCDPAVPSSTVVPRRFTPDGKLLIGSECDLRKILIFTYNGAMAGQQTIWQAAGRELHEQLSSNLFERYFTLRWEIPLQHEFAPLQVHTALVTPDSRFLLAVVRWDSGPREAPQRPSYYQSDRVALDGIASILEDWSVWVINLASGKVTSRIEFPADALASPGPSGQLMCQLFNYTFVVLSVPHQTIHFHHLDHRGTLARGIAIGSFCLRDDEMIYNQGFPIDAAASSCRGKHGTFSTAEPKPDSDQPLVGLKQKLVTFCFRRALTKGNLDDFYQSYQLLLSLRISRMQLLSDEFLLLRYHCVTEVWQSWTMEVSRHGILAVYNVKEAAFEEVFMSESPSALGLILHHSHRLGGYEGLIQNTRANDLHHTATAMLKVQSVEDVAESFAGILPLGNSSSTSSPYTDSSLFRSALYGQRSPSALAESPEIWIRINRPEMEIRRADTGKVVFTMRFHDDSIFNPRVLTLFHPHEPLALSCTLTPTSQYPKITLHVRNMPDPIGVRQQ